jgi:hypothetical protein
MYGGREGDYSDAYGEGIDDIKHSEQIDTLDTVMRSRMNLDALAKETVEEATSWRCSPRKKMMEYIARAKARQVDKSNLFGDGLLPINFTSQASALDFNGAKALDYAALGFMMHVKAREPTNTTTRREEARNGGQSLANVTRESTPQG